MVSSRPTECRYGIPSHTSHLQPTDESMVKAWGPSHGQRGTRTVVWGKAPAGLGVEPCSGAEPWSGGQGVKPTEAESFLAFAQPEKLANLSYNLFFCRTKNCQTLGSQRHGHAMASWIRQCFRPDESNSTVILSTIIATIYSLRQAVCCGLRKKNHQNPAVH